MPSDQLPKGIYRHRDRFRVQKMIRGTLIRKSFGTLAEARGFLAAIDADVEDARAVESARVSGAATVMEIVKLWWLGPLVDGEHRGGHRVRVSGVTARGYQYYIDAYISRIGDESAQAYARNTALLKLFYDTLPNRCAWHVHGVLRMAFRDAVTRRLMNRNPCDVEKPAPRKRRKRHIPSRTDVDKIITAAEEQDPQWGLFIYLTSVLGTRCGETVALQAHDFDDQLRIVHIERAVSKTSGRPTIKVPKNGETRDLPIDGSEFWDHVLPFLTRQGFLFPGFFRDGPRDGSESKPWHPDHAEKRFKTMVRSLGFPDYTLHSMRHFVATQLLIEGQPVNQVAEFLGHSPNMTLMLYGRHLDREAMRNVGRAATRLARPPVATSTPEVEVRSIQRAPVVDQRMADALLIELASRAPVTNALVRSETGLTRRQASKALDRLVRNGRMQRRGTKRGTDYVLSAEEAAAGDQRKVERG